LPQEALIDELWPEAEGEDASDRLRQQIRDLRKLTTYEGVIFGDGRYRLNDRLVMTDVQRLEESIRAFSDRRRDLSQRVAAFDSALRLYRGPILPGSESRLVTESRERIAAHLKAMGTAFLRGLARQDATKAALRRRRLAKLV
jgi:LuxR family transcriptional regulator, maltose regulon positive regulatory protein